MKTGVFTILLVMLTSILVFAANPQVVSPQTETVQAKFKAALASHHDLHIPENRIDRFSQRLVEQMQERGMDTVKPYELDQIIQQQIEMEVDRIARVQLTQQQYQSNFEIASSSATAAVSAQDSLALVALYNSTDGANWRINTNWLTDKPVEKWYGVSVIDGNITRLYLDYNNLNGTIPPELGNLRNLEWLYMESNELSGQIPAELGNLTNLKSLFLGNNKLSGTIPIEFGNLINLENLYLSSNELSGTIPTEFGKLVNLEYLSLGSNNYSGAIPSVIFDLVNLRYLYLSSNAFSGTIPSELGNLINLIDLNLSWNNLNGNIPSEIGSLLNLESIYLPFNDLAGPIPAELYNLPNLINLHLGGNSLNGTIPAKLANLVNLESLYLGSNDYSGTIPPELGDMINLRGLDLGYNNLCSPIPSELANLSNLWELSLCGNQFDGAIPTWLGDMISLGNLYLYDNQFSGNIPSDLCNLTNLYILDLRGNQLSGAIPGCLADLTNLGGLDLAYNQFTDMPDLSALTSLYSLYCYDNKLTFEDLEPNMSLPINYFRQDSVDIYGPLWVTEGATITLSVDVGGSANTYQWYKDYIPVSGAVQDELTIDPVTDTDFGVYFCVITNPLCPSLTLYSRKMNIDKDALGTINVVVWHDANENGQVDATEQGLGGIQVRVPFEDKVSKHLTNNSGKTGFRLPAGSYAVQLEGNDLPLGARCTTSGLELTVNLDQNTRYTTVYFGFAGSNVAAEADEPVNRPVEQEDIPADDALVVVDGSVTFDNGKTSREWSNAVDGKVNGWDATTLAMPDSGSSESTPWAIFKFADDKAYKFNYIKFCTDNGTDDDNAHKVFKARKIEVLVSMTGNENDDFTSIGVFTDKYGQEKMQWCKLNAYVFARYIKLRLLDPVVPGHWTEIVEFALDTSDKNGPILASEDQQIAIMPQKIDLLTNYPNPFNPSTTIVYQVEKESQVSVRIYDILGKQITELVNTRQHAGRYEIDWQAENLPSGVYFVTLNTATSKVSKRILLMK